jgi:crossover junction endodeoxyribonuclease RuvC
VSVPIRILGVDPGLNRCGWGLITSEGSRLSYVAHGVVAPNPKLSLAERLGAVCAGLEEVIAAHHPDEAAVEETFVNANPRAALALGQARGAAMVAVARCGLLAGEYPPATIKKAVVGTGQADKTQIAFMVRRLLPACGDASADAADALAVAICHAAHGSMRKRIGSGS